MNKVKAREILKGTHNGDMFESIKLIDEAIDYLLTLEEITLCKDCKYYNEFTCTYFDEFRPEKHYCSYGERRLDDTV